MGHRKFNVVEALLTPAAALPWWVSALLAVASFFFLGEIAGGAVSDPSVEQGIASASGWIRLGAGIGQFAFPILFLVGASISIGRRLKTAHLSAALEEGAEDLPSAAGGQTGIELIDPRMLREFAPRANGDERY